MNWREIEKKRPLAWKVFTEDFSDRCKNLEFNSSFLVVIWEDGSFVEYNLRDLYDFFNLKRITILPFTDLALIKSGEKAPKWEASLYDAVADKYANIIECRTRKEAEEEGFKQAFYLLEQRLLKEQGIKI